MSTDAMPPLPSTNPQTRPPSPQKASQAPPKGVPRTFDQWALLAGLRRRWLLAPVLSVFFAGAAGAGGWYFLPPGHHPATRVLHVAAAPPSIVGDAQQRTDFQTFKQTQVA